MTDFFVALFIIGLILGSTEFRRFNKTITVWFRDTVPFFDRFNIPVATALIIIGLLGILMGW